MTDDQRGVEQRRVDTDALAAAWTAALDVLEGETLERARLAPWIALRELESEAERAVEKALAAPSSDETDEERKRLAATEYDAALTHSVASLVALALSARRLRGKSLVLVAMN